MIFSEKVNDHFANPRNIGKLEAPDGVGEVTSPTCGDTTAMYIKVDGGIISDIKFKTFG